MTELKPCPFCGGEADKLTSSDGFTSIGCLRCNPVFGVMVQAPTEAEAAAAWNTRHVETCRNVSDPPEGFLCSECGWGDFAEPSHLLTGSCYAGLAKGPRYCPNCGRLCVE